jgi:hypothetical protein
MSINNIELTGAMLNELFRNTLVDDTENKPAIINISERLEGPVPAVNKQSEGIKYLGNNKKNILLLMKYPDAVYLPDPALQFLTGILGACQLSLDDVAIINLAVYPNTTFKEVMSFFNSRIIMLFGIEPASIGLPINFPHFQLQAFTGYTFLYSPSLEELENNKELKIKLWSCLKRLFNI